MSTPIVISYYGQTKAFTAVELQNGTFEGWLNSVYAQHLDNPCQGVLSQQTAITSTNLTTNIVQNVMNLTTIANLGSIDVDVGGNINGGSPQLSRKNRDNKNDEVKQTPNGSSSDKQPSSEISSDNSSNNSSDKPGGSSNTSSGSSKTNETKESSDVSGSNSGSSEGSNTDINSDNSSGSDPGENSNSGGNVESKKSGSGNGGKGEVQGESQKNETAPEEKIEEVKGEQTKSSSQQVSKSTSRSRTKTQKPAILMTGDIVGLQQTSDSSNDARATVSYTKVKGDGSASIGVSADYMVKARIGNVTVMKSWIGTNEKGNKHINLVSSGFSLQPNAWSTTNMFIRVNSMKRLTAIYGAAGSYGILYNEPMTSTLAIGGFMYKGLMLKKIEATIIAAGIYSPYTKYYTEEWWTNKPVVIPFFNLNYKITKTFGIGITGGGTYLAGEDVLNYQVLFGAKMIL